MGFTAGGSVVDSAVGAGVGAAVVVDVVIGSDVDGDADGATLGATVVVGAIVVGAIVGAIVVVVTTPDVVELGAWVSNVPQAAILTNVGVSSTVFALMKSSMTATFEMTPSGSFLPQSPP